MHAAGGVLHGAFEDEIDAETVVPFGLLDVVDDWEGRW